MGSQTPFQPQALGGGHGRHHVTEGPAAAHTVSFSPSFNGLGQLITDYQAHGGAVNTSTTPKVQYTWSEMAGGANHSRPTSIIYPNGRVLHYVYSSGVDNSISRLSYLADDNGSGGIGTHLEEYSYLGLDTVVQRVHPQPGVNLTYIASANGEAGDKYAGLDRFGRVVDQRWLKSSNNANVDRHQYGYDRDDNGLFSANLVDAVFSELYVYDNLNQLTSFQRGTLTSDRTAISGTPTRSQSWSLDAVGNFGSVTTNGTTVNRTNNKQNEVTAVGSATLTFDANGNTTKDENGNQLKYDGWNRLLQVKNASNTVLATYKYDALGRRIVENHGSDRDLYYSAAWQVLEERVGGTADRQYVWSTIYVDALILRDRDTDANGTLDERLYVLQDANFNVTMLINSSGTVVEKYSYDPFGTVAIRNASNTSLSSSSVGWQILHQGKRIDFAVGLYDSRMRIYSPSLGRWLQADPLGLRPDMNAYRQVANNPTNYSDPFGLRRIKDLLTAAPVIQRFRECTGV